MGLNGRKSKQRIGNDPRNLSWADDAARFGINYLAKFGWDSSKGLGASGEGRKSHLEVSKRLDMLGIGAVHQMDPNGIAWKQNKDFENLLKRLNGDVAEGSIVEGFRKADSGEMDGVGEEVNGVQDKEKKRKRDDGKQAPKKKKKFEKEEREEKEDSRANEPIHLPLDKETTSSGSSERRQILPRHRAHRARAIAAKKLSSKSAAHISEILGIAPSTTATPSRLTSGTDTPQDVELASDTLEIDRITTSTKSVYDYFKEKLKNKTFVSPFASALDHTEQDAPRGGLGSSSRTAFGSSTVSSAHKAAVRPSVPSNAAEVAVETEVAEMSATTPDTIKKKRSIVTNEKWGEGKPLVDREDTEGKMISVVGEDIPTNLATKKKKSGKRKKERNRD